MSEQLVIVERSARFSEDRLYRYRLTRKWAHGPTVAFVGLNPSTADETTDDPTIRRCVGFAKRWGYGKLLMVNLYAYRATNPRDLVDALDAGIDVRGELISVALAVEAVDRNLAEISLACLSVDRVVCAWGANPGPMIARRAQVLDRLVRSRADVVALALTQDGQPRHPLYVRSDVEPVPYPTTEGE